jgi:hypothetical protein
MSAAGQPKTGQLRSNPDELDAQIQAVVSVTLHDHVRNEPSSD